MTVTPVADKREDISGANPPCPLSLSEIKFPRSEAPAQPATASVAEAYVL